MPTDERLYPLCKCPYCGHLAPASLRAFARPADGVRVTVCTCAACENVLNLDTVPYLEWVPRYALHDLTGWVHHTYGP